MFIVSILLGGLLSPLSQRIEQADRANTQIALDEIEEALYGFAVTNGRMVCPDCMDNNGTCAGSTANDGQEDINAGSCAANISAGALNFSTGNVPWVTLATPQNDAWGNPFTYSVTTETADSIASNTVAVSPVACTTLPVQSSIALCTAGNLTIQNQGDSCAGVPTTIATQVVAVVVSHGKNALRTAAGQVATPVAAKCSEFENHFTDNDGVYASANYADPEQNNAASFDDMMIWISPNILKNRFISAGRLP